MWLEHLARVLACGAKYIRSRSTNEELDFRPLLAPILRRSRAWTAIPLRSPALSIAGWRKALCEAIRSLCNARDVEHGRAFRAESSRTICCLKTSRLAGAMSSLDQCTPFRRMTAASVSDRRRSPQWDRPMHELSIAMSILDVAQEEVDRAEAGVSRRFI